MNNSFVASSPMLSLKKEPVAESTTITRTDSAVSKVVLHFLPPMTIRRKQVKENGEVELVESPITNPWLRLILSQHGWRLIIILLIATMHPVGRSFLAGFGFEFQDTRKIAVAAENADAAKQELTTISDSIKEIKLDVASLKANNAILNTKVDAIGEKQGALELKFSGFQIDFSKWKPQEKP